MQGAGGQAIRRTNGTHVSRDHHKDHEDHKDHNPLGELGDRGELRAQSVAPFRIGNPTTRLISFPPVYFGLHE
jgi:hypothetical protein